MRLAIVGSRSIQDKELIYFYASKYNPDVVLCGGARGPDLLGSYWAKDNLIPVEYFIPKWEEIGKSAGILRNKQMSDSATHILAFWDGKSKGTKHMIEYSRMNNKAVEVILVE
jgi:hypothetical protein